MSNWLDISIGGGITIFSLIVFLLLLTAAILIGRLAYLIIRRSLDDKVGRRLSKNAARLVQYAIIFTAAGYGFGTILRLDFSGLLLSLGLVTVAVAFASQQIIQNFISGIIISITRPIQIEDWIEVGSSPESSVSRVKDITLMSTVLRETSGRIIIVPNSQIITGKVINYTKAGFVAVTVPLWIESLTSLDQIKAIVYEEADKDPKILPQVDGEEKVAFQRILERPAIMNLFRDDANLKALDPQVNVVDIQGSRTLVRIKVWIREIDKKEQILSNFLVTLKKRFEAENIKLQDS
jgi:small-conductance mechanosensitive channel